MPLVTGAGLGLGSNANNPLLVRHCGGFLGGVKADNGFAILRELPAVGLEGQADLYLKMASLAAQAGTATPVFALSEPAAPFRERLARHNPGWR
jgi:hypothetical protein